MYVRACVCACLRMCVHAYVRAYVLRACICACVHMCQSRSGMSICTHLHPFALICTHVHAQKSWVTCIDDGGRGIDISRVLYCVCAGKWHRYKPCLISMVEDRKERRFLTMEDAEDIATGPPQRMCFAESSAERSRRLATLRKRKQRSQCTKDAKRARREPDKVQK